MQMAKKRSKKLKSKSSGSSRVQITDDPSWLSAEPEGALPEPPVSTRSGTLPFTRMGKWEDFERLCYQLSTREGEVERSRAYGKSGHAQLGIDVLVRKKDGSYGTWQSKRHKTFSPAKLHKAVELFLEHKWASQSKEFVLAVACEFSSPEVVDAIEQAHDKLAKVGIEFRALDVGDLTKLLIPEPELVDDFFGRPWVESVCPREALQRLENRLSRFEISSVRQRLKSCYTSWFSVVDPGLPIAGQDSQGRTIPAVPIPKRYVRPDIVVRSDRADLIVEGSAQNQRDQESSKRAAELGDRDIRPGVIATRTPPRERRMSIDDYLITKEQSLVIGDAGAGKSTLLRLVALDLLEGDPSLKATRERYRGFLPVWVPFALWARMAADQSSMPSLEDVVFAFFQAQGDGDLARDMRKAVSSQKIILLVDGLDEASDQAAAQLLVALLSAYVDRRNIPVIATSRPHGIRSLSGFRGSWGRVELAPLSDAQRHALATIWFKLIEEIETEGASSASQITAHANRKADNFISTLRRNPGITRLSQTPLFLLALLNLHRHGHDLPRSRFAASKEIVEQLIEHQPKRRGVSALIKDASTAERRLRDRLISDFAYALQVGELQGSVPDSATEEDAVARATRLVLERQGNEDIEKAEGLARAIFAFTEERAGLLVKKSPGNIGFLHLSLQEYLAAHHLRQRSPSEKHEFIREHATEPRWREPILYLLFLTENEQEVGHLVEAIESASAKDAHGRILKDTLLSDAVFSDFAHSLPVVRRLAEKFFIDAETCVWGERRRHLLGGVVDGLFSESVGGMCRSKLSEWIPDRHGYGRAGALRNMPNWDPAIQRTAIPILYRCLRSENEMVWRAAAEALPRLSGGDAEVKNTLRSLCKHAPSVEMLQASLFSLGRGWAKDSDVGSLAEVLRKSTHTGLCIDALRIRADRNETDSDDFERFFSIVHEEDRFSTALFAPDLIGHFSRAHRKVFMERLEAAIKDSRSGRAHDIIPLLGSLAICDPEHPLMLSRLRDLLSQQDWVWHELFRESGWLHRIKWTPELIEQVEAYVGKKEDYREHEFYWISKAVKRQSLKQKFIEGLQGHKHLSFWSSRALVEGWGPGDPEVQALFSSFLDADPEHVSDVAEELPLVIHDKQACRKTLIRALRAPKLRRYDFLVKGLRNLGIPPDDDEAVSAALSVDISSEGPLFQDMWRGQIIAAFPTRAEVRAIALEELRRDDGNVGAISSSYGDDQEMCKRLLDVLCPLDLEARLILMSNLHSAAASNQDALEVLASSQQDSEGSVAAEAIVGRVEAELTRGDLKAEDIDYLESELQAVGPDNEFHRAAGLVGLTLSGHLDRFAKAKRYDGKPLEIRTNPRLGNDDSMLRRLLPYWRELTKALGGEEQVWERLELSAETTLRMMQPGTPNAEHLFRLLLAKVPTTMHVRDHDVIAAIARFAPQSDEMLAKIRPLLLERGGHGYRGMGRSYGDYWASLATTEIFAEHFSDDTNLKNEIIEVFVAEPRSGTAAGALAELILRKPDAEIHKLLHGKARGINYDTATYFKIIAAVAPPEFVIERLSDLLEGARNLNDLSLNYWVPALIRRIKSDEPFQELLYEALAQGLSSSVQVSFPALLGKATGTTDRLRKFAATELTRLEQQDVPLVGFDLTASRHRLGFHVLTDLIS